jgi:hypothetical protein
VEVTVTLKRKIESTLCDAAAAAAAAVVDLTR